MKIGDFETKSDLIMSDSEHEEILGTSSPIFFAYILYQHTQFWHMTKNLPT